VTSRDDTLYLVNFRIRLQNACSYGGRIRRLYVEIHCGDDSERQGR
jgi:hypothetical protein